MRGILLPLCTLFAASAAHAAPSDQVQRIFGRLAGTPLPTSDPRYAQMLALVQANNFSGAADIAAEDDGFINLTVKRAFTALSNRDQDPTVTLNDFVATALGAIRDDLDGRTLLTGNFIYKSDLTVENPAAAADPEESIHTDFAVYESNVHYQYLESRLINLRQKLVQTPQRGFPSNSTAVAATPLVDSAGLLTTRAWASAHLIAGTNRRAIEWALKLFLCSPIATWSDTSNPDDRIRRDVERNPGGNVRGFLNSCRGCHSGMDGLGGAYAFFDFSQSDGGDFRIVYSAPTVQSKLNKNGTIYPSGFVTGDDSWINYLTQNQNTSFGWTGPITGSGIREFGVMLTTSPKFSSCMAKLAFTEACRREPVGSEEASITALATDFRQNGYKFKRLFKRATILPECLGK